MTPGGYELAGDPVVIDRERITITVVNSGVRPVQVGSHYHFAAANPALLFDRDAARGRRLAVAAGTAVRFEPGIERTVELVELGGTATVPGLCLPTPSAPQAPPPPIPRRPNLGAGSVPATDGQRGVRQ